MSESSEILILNGPNLNMLGVREPDIYGCETLADIEELCNQRATSLGLTVNFKQSNLEGEIVADIQNARGTAAGIIINAAGYTHTSVAILDALNISELPVIELHISNIHAREAFRHHSYVAQAATGIICGFGSHGYVLAIDAMARLIECAEGWY